MREAQIAGWGILLLVAGTVYTLTHVHHMSALHADSVNQEHHFAIDFGRVIRRHHHFSNNETAEAAAAPRKIGSPTIVSPVPQKAAAAQQQQGGEDAADVLFAPKAETAGKCFAYPHVDSWGVALNYGSGFKVTSAADCCEACLKARGLGIADQADCNVWVWCGDQERCGQQYNECWLKWLPYIRIAVPKEVSFNDSVAWTSGTSMDLDLTEVMHSWKLKAARKGRRPLAAPGSGSASASTPPGQVDPVQLVDTSLKKLKEGVSSPQMYHTITSVQGAYNQWQTRIHYYHWRKMQAACRAQGGCEMGGYTRLLHSGQPDQIMDEIPTVVVDPMPSSLLKHDDYIVLNRPYAFVTWVKSANIPERYVLMAEPDHLFLRPLPNFMTGDRPAAFNFGYMNPAGDENCPHVQRHTGIPSSPRCEEVAPIGNSPTFLTLEDMKAVMPLWLNYSIAVYKDKKATKTWGWVQEMYAFAMAVWSAGLKEVDLYGHLMAQPPYDGDYELTPGRPFYILHYTYGLDFNQTSGKVLFSTVGDWHFDKREHDPMAIPRDMREPSDNVDFDLGRVMIRAFNEATAAIPCWNQYRESKGRTVTKDCGEKPGGFLATLDP